MLALPASIPTAAATRLTSDQLFSLSLATRCFSVVGCIGAFCVIFFYFFDPRPHSALSRPLLFAALGDCLSAASKLFGALPTYSNVWDKPSGSIKVEVNLECQAQAVILQTADMFSLLWSVFIAGCLYHIVCRSRHQSAPAAVRRWDRVWALAALLTSLAVSLPWVWVGEDASQPQSRGPVYGTSVTWCWISDTYPWIQIFVLYVPVVLVFFITFAIFGAVGIKIWHTERVMQRSREQVMLAMAAATVPIPQHLASTQPSSSSSSSSPLPAAATARTTTARPSLSHVYMPTTFGSTRVKFTTRFFGRQSQCLTVEDGVGATGDPKQRNPSSLFSSPATLARHNRRRNNLRRFATGVLAYLLVFCLSWMPGLASRIYFIVTREEEYSVLMMRAVFGSIRGLFGLVMFLYLVRKTDGVVKRRCRQHLRGRHRIPLPAVAASFGARKESVISLHELDLRTQGFGAVQSRQRYHPARKDSAQWMADMGVAADAAGQGASIETLSSWRLQSPPNRRSTSFQRQSLSDVEEIYLGAECKTDASDTPNDGEEDSSDIYDLAVSPAIEDDHEPHDSSNSFSWLRRASEHAVRARQPQSQPCTSSPGFGAAHDPSPAKTVEIASSQPEST